MRIVLVRPRNPQNIGAVARVMANFGFEDLAVVSPYPPVWEEARRAAPGGEKILEAAKVAASLEEAVAGCHLVAATTSGSRRKLDAKLVAPSAFRPRGRTALVFGSEKTGLTNEDLSFCHVLLRIPTTPDAPSMNLAQAVAVCCYEIARRGQARMPAPQAAPTAGDVLRLLQMATPLLEASGFFDARTRAARSRKLRGTLLKANLTADDVALLTAAVRRLEYWSTERR